MFFWFASETFSIIDALIKLILVITGSALIICFCHKLTNYKKSRRYKSGGGQSVEAAVATIRLAGGDYTGAASLSGGQCGGHNPNHHLLAAYDPYNTIRPFGCLNAVEAAGIHLAPQLASAYGFQPGSCLNAAGQSGGVHIPLPLPVESLALAASGSQPHQHPAFRTQTTTESNTVTNLIANPIYSTSVQSDCSGFRATQQQQPHQQPQEIELASAEQEACPSYEEAIAAASEPVDGFQVADQSRHLGATTDHDDSSNNEGIGSNQQLPTSSSDSAGCGPPTEVEEQPANNDDDAQQDQSD